MGYTHYWTCPYTSPDRGPWEQFVCDTIRIVEAAEAVGVRVTGPLGIGAPRIRDRGIELNGDRARDEDFETFLLIPPELSESSNSPEPVNRGWDFCQTGRNPYDLVVCSVLLRLHLLLPQTFLIASDGDWTGDWDRPMHGISPRQLVADLFGPAPQANQLSRIT